METGPRGPDVNGVLGHAHREGPLATAPAPVTTAPAVSGQTLGEDKQINLAPVFPVDIRAIGAMAGIGCPGNGSGLKTLKVTFKISFGDQL